MSENFTFDSDGGSDDLALRRHDLVLFGHLQEVPESSLPLPPTSATDLFRIPENESLVLGEGVQMQLLNQDEREKADLLLIYPKANVDGNCITAFHFIVVAKIFLHDLKVSQNHVEGVRHPKATVRLLCRLSRELKSAPSHESVNLPDEFSDPADYDGCLGVMLKDIVDYIKCRDTPSLPDGYVYVRRGTDTYVECLLAAATELNSLM